jgi:hypothetical protein
MVAWDRLSTPILTPVTLGTRVAAMTGSEASNDLDPDLQPRKANVHLVDVAGLLCGAVPFALSYSKTTSSYSSTDGARLEMGTTTKSHMDYVALGGGAIAALCAIIGLAMIGRMGSRPLRLGIFIVLLALGGFQIMRGVLADTGKSSSSGVMF